MATPIYIPKFRKEAFMFGKKSFSLLAVFIIAMGLFGLNAWGFEIVTKTDLVKKIVTIVHLYKMADNAIFLIDASSSMDKRYKDTGRTRYQIMVDTLRERNEYLPDLGYNFGMYLYTPWKEIYPMQRFDRRKFAEALEQLPERPTGSTQIQPALRRLDGILKNLKGKTVVFLFTDGTYTELDHEQHPALIANRLAKRHDVCFFVASTADDRFGRQAIANVSNANFCSRAIAYDRFIDRPEYSAGALYVTKADVKLVTYTETRITGIQTENVLFQFDEDSFDPEFEKNLNRLGSFMQNNPQTFAVLAGYTDNIGTQEYNIGLSKRRADRVAQYLDDNFGIGPDRIVSLWYGPNNPVASNSTVLGRKLNRRVEIAVGIQ